MLAKKEKETEGNEVNKKNQESTLQKGVTVATFQSSNIPCFTGS